MASEMKIEIRQVSATASEAALGKHRLLIDRPVEKGGSGAGPMGGELFLASIGGCFMSNLLAAVRARDARVKDGCEEKAQRAQRTLRQVGLGGQILSDLGIHRIRLLTNTPTHVPALQGFGIEIVEQIPLVAVTATIPS